MDATNPRELDVSLHLPGFGWGSRQKQKGREVPLGFRSQLWKGAEQRDSPMEKKLQAVYLSLQHHGSLVSDAKDTIPRCWMDWELAKPQSGVAKPATLHKWCAFLQQRRALSTSPLCAELHAVLGPVAHISEMLGH